MTILLIEDNKGIAKGVSPRGLRFRCKVQAMRRCFAIAAGRLTPKSAAITR